MTIGRFFIVSTNASDKIIKDGPIIYDTTSTYAPPAGTQLMQEDIAISNGYTFPPRPAFLVNADSLRVKAQTALATNAAYQGLARPLTNAQVVAQVDALTRQVTALIRLAISQTEDVSGT